MLKKVLIGIVVVFAGFGAFVATRPAQFHVERAATVNAPADVVFAQVNDFRAWAAWSPWEKLDATMKKTYSGPAAGTGANYAWVGNDKVGEGSMTITASQPNEKISIRLVFLKPWQATNVTTFSFKPSGDSTLVTWAMDGDLDFMAKAMHVFMDMDKMVGGDFDRGLAEMKKVAEAEAQKRAEEAKKKAEEEAKRAAEAKVLADAAAAAPAPKGAPAKKK